jgi:regulatory protein YycI of two-component signal transduction system YycFG
VFTKKRNGKVEYSHQALQAIICHPDQKQIFPLMSEPIKNTDGDKKQDCKINVDKRLLPKLRYQHLRINFI